MFCIGLAMTLRPGAYATYKAAHDGLWPELAAGMRTNQVSIAIYRDGDRLLLFAAVPSESHWQRSRSHQENEGNEELQALLRAAGSASDDETG